MIGAPLGHLGLLVRWALKVNVVNEARRDQEVVRVRMAWMVQSGRRAIVAHAGLKANVVRREKLGRQGQKETRGPKGPRGGPILTFAP